MKLYSRVNVFGRTSGFDSSGSSDSSSDEGPVEWVFQEKHQHRRDGSEDEEGEGDGGDNWETVISDNW